MNTASWQENDVKFLPHPSAEQRESRGLVLFAALGRRLHSVCVAEYQKDSVNAAPREFFRLASLQLLRVSEKWLVVRDASGSLFSTTFEKLLQMSRDGVTPYVLLAAPFAACLLCT